MNISMLRITTLELIWERDCRIVSKIRVKRDCMLKILNLSYVSNFDSTCFIR